MRRCTLLILVAVVAAGCTSEEQAPTTVTAAPATTVPETTTVPGSAATAPDSPRAGLQLPSGWSTFRGSNYAIGLPELWVDGRSFLEDPDVRQAISDQLEGADLGGFEGLAQSLLSSEGVDFLFNMAAFTGSFAENLNVLQFPAGAADDLALARDLGPAQLEAAGATDVTSEVVDLDRFPALFITYRIPDVGVAQGHQYWVATDATVFVLTFSGSEGADPALWRQMVDTFAPGS